MATRIGQTVVPLVSFAALLAVASCSSEQNPQAAGGGTNAGSGGGAGGPSSGTGGNPMSPSGGASAAGTAGTGGMPGTAGTSGAGGSGGTGGNATAGGGGGGGAGGSGGSGSGAPVFHIFMLMGQSNMVGVARAEESDKNTDSRLLVWGGCNQPDGQWNTATPPLSDCPGQSGINLSNVVDPGIWFAKTLLEKLPTGHTIGLVGTAESGESINTFVSGGEHHEMILDKIAAVKGAENARFAGIIFHQGESDNTSPTWPWPTTRPGSR